MLNFSHMSTPEWLEKGSEAPAVSRAFARAVSDPEHLVITRRTGARAIHPEDIVRKPWIDVFATVPGALDLRRHSEVKSSDIPGRLDITGDLIIGVNDLSIVSGKDINVGRNLIIVVPRGTSNRDNIIHDAWAIDGMSIAGDVLLQEEPESKDGKTPEAKTAKTERIRLTRMTREEFAEYLIAHRKEYAQLSKHPEYMDPGVSADDLYALITTKHSRRGKPALETVDPEFVAQIRAKSGYEAGLRALPGVWSKMHKPEESRLDATSRWSHWTINGGYEKESTKIRHKGYVTLKQGTIDLTPIHIIGIVAAVQKTGVRCELKMPAVGTRVVKQFDNIALHATETSDIERALSAIRTYCEKNTITIEAMELGADGDGTSHSDRIAKRVHRAWEEQDRKKT